MKFFGLGKFFQQQKNNKNNTPKLKLCFFEGGGVGDCLLILPLLEQIYKKSPVTIQIDFYSRFPDLCKNLEFLNHVDKIKPISELQNVKYDGIFQVIRYARFVSGDLNKIKKIYPLLNEYISIDQKIKKIGKIRDDLRLFNYFALSLGKTRCDQADLFNVFKYDHTEFRGLQLLNDNILQMYELTPKTYITINRGCDGVFNENHPKLWPLDYYDKLVQMIHDKYPTIKIIQIGKDSKFGTIKQTDINLVGRTNFEQVATLMKNAIIHIDTEGGLVHLNHFVNGKSLVLFGPTDPQIYGYAENINIQGTCPQNNCYNIVSNWTNGCILNTHACMKSITPRMVFQKIQLLLKNEGQINA